MVPMPTIEEVTRRLILCQRTKINRINEERIAVNKTPVGFINPVLYQNPQVLNDSKYPSHGPYILHTYRRPVINCNLMIQLLMAVTLGVIRWGSRLLRDGILFLA